MKRKPLVGITYADTAFRDEEMRIRTYVTRKYSQAVQRGGADAILLPFTTEKETLKRYLGLIDALLLPGGEDIDPRYQGEEPSPRLGIVNPFRDEFELQMAGLAFAAKKPTIGICRGCQVMAIALGGKLIADLVSMPEAIQHIQQSPRWATSHKVKIMPESRLCSLLKTTETFTNSFHHQAVRVLPKTLRAVAWSGDGLIEAIESLDDRFFVGVQWHPEELSLSDDPSRSFFEEFVAAV